MENVHFSVIDYAVDLLRKKVFRLLQMNFLLLFHFGVLHTYISSSLIKMKSSYGVFCSNSKKTKAPLGIKHLQEKRVAISFKM